MTNVLTKQNADVIVQNVTDVDEQTSDWGMRNYVDGQTIERQCASSVDEKTSDLVKKRQGHTRHNVDGQPSELQCLTEVNVQKSDQDVSLQEHQRMPCTSMHAPCPNVPPPCPIVLPHTPLSMQTACQTAV